MSSEGPFPEIKMTGFVFHVSTTGLFFLDHTSNVTNTLLLMFHTFFFGILLKSKQPDV